jgi:hypothetical protein
VVAPSTAHNICRSAEPLKTADLLGPSLISPVLIDWAAKHKHAGFFLHSGLWLLGWLLRLVIFLFSCAVSVAALNPVPSDSLIGLSPSIVLVDIEREVPAAFGQMLGVACRSYQRSSRRRTIDVSRLESLYSHREWHKAA